MGDVTKIVSAVAGPLVGGIFGKDKQDPQQYAAQNSAPVQTAEQAQISKSLLPKIEGWLTNAPKVNIPKPTQTQFKYGNMNMGQQPQKNTFFGSGGGGSNPAQNLPSNMRVTPLPNIGSNNVGQNFQQPQQTASNGFSFTPGQWQQNGQNAQIDSVVSQMMDELKNLGGQINSSSGSTSSSSSPVSQAKDGEYWKSAEGKAERRKQLMDDINYYTRHPNVAITDPYLADVFGGIDPNTGRPKSRMGVSSSMTNKQIDNLLNKGYGIPEGRYQPSGSIQNNASGNSAIQGQIDAITSGIQALQGQRGPEQVFQGGSVNIPEAPKPEKTMGSMGGYQGYDYSGFNNEIMSPVNTQRASQNPYGDYKEQDYGNLINDITNFKNPLVNASANAAKNNVGREITQGYDKDYLKKLSDQQIDPLTRAYQEAIKSSTADFNRRGLGGSGFEAGQKYGSQDNSITSKYLDAAGKASRDIALRDAEANREDRYRNIGVNNQDIQLANSIGQNIGADQLNRVLSGLSSNMQQDQMNEANRQSWDANQLNKNNIDYGREMDQKRLLTSTMQNIMNQNQQNEANRMNWAGFLDNQNKYDQSQNIADWTRNLDMMKWLAGREDSLTDKTQGADLAQQQSDLDYQQQAINNAMAFINGQNPAAATANRNYWNAYGSQQAANRQADAYNQNLSNMAGAAFNQWLTPQTFPTQQQGNNAMNQAMSFMGVPISIF